MLDLHPAAFPIGMATRTLFIKAEIVLWRREADLYHIEVWRSFAGYLSGLLNEAALEYLKS
jgi:sarcosine oxidase subunit gamma